MGTLTDIYGQRKKTDTGAGGHGNALAAVELAREEMKKDAIDARIIAIGQNAIVKEENEDELRKYLLSKFQDGDKVKIIIIKE